MDAPPILLQIGSPHEEGLWAFLNSAFASALISSLIGALAGAFAGAYGAHFIAERSKSREVLLDQIRSVNLATATAVNIFSLFSAAKSQHIDGLKKNFDTEFQKVQLALSAAALRKQNSPVIIFNASLDSLPELAAPFEILQEIIYSKLSITGRPLAMINSLKQSVISYNNFIRQRNDFIENLRLNPLPPQNVAEIYFGIRSESGRMDQRYPNLVNAIYMACEDLLFFSYTMTNDLMKHGEKLSEEYTRRFKTAPQITRASFRQAEEAGLIPSAELYPNWNNSFYPTQEEYEKSLR